MGNPAIVFDGVWKKFRRGERHDSLRDLIPSTARRLWQRPVVSDLSTEEFWALKDVSFEVEPGQALGIIGPNGAGKSTTLKLLTKILRPTRGVASVTGRVGALIEVAAGFHPDLTGLENIYLQGAIMGMKRADISRKLEAIIEFAGVREFIDTPVKRYSSGMNARLGFSVAAHLDPEVLIIDEVLSVGDMPFQQRCFDRVAEFRRQGAAIVFVSHNLQAVMRLCDHALHLQHAVCAYGRSDEVVNNYVRSTGEARTLSSDGDLVICGAELRRDDESDTPMVSPGDELALRVNYRVKRPATQLSFGFSVLRSTDHMLVYDGNFLAEELGLGTLTEGATFTVEFKFRVNLTRGQYHLACHVFHNPTNSFVSRLSPAGMISVHETRSYCGIADLQVRPTVLAADTLSYPAAQLAASNLR